MLPAERRVEAEREESWRTTEHERWREFVRATQGWIRISGTART